MKENSKVAGVVVFIIKGKERKKDLSKNYRLGLNKSKKAEFKPGDKEKKVNEI